MSTSAAPLPSLWDHDPPARPATAPGPPALRSRRPTPPVAGRGRRDPRLQRGEGPPARVRRLHDHLRARSRTGSASRSRTTRRPTAPRGSPRGWPRSCPGWASSGWSRRAAAAPCGPCGPHPTPPVLAYMDVDLSTDLNAAAPAGRSADLRPLATWRSAPGSPAPPGSCAVPSASSSAARYNLILRGSLAARFSDAQCGFKAIRARCGAGAAAAGRGHRLVLRHRDAGARRAGRAAHPRGAGRLGRRPRLHAWTSSRTATATSRASGGWAARWPPARCRWTGCAALRRRSRDREMRPAGWLASSSASARSACVAPCPTCALQRLPRLTGAQSANALALLMSAVANTAANRRLTFGVRGRRRRGPPPGAGPGRLRHRAGADQRFARALARRQRAGPAPPLELAVLVAANLAATVLRFLLLRGWVFPRPARDRMTTAP